MVDSFGDLCYGCAGLALVSQSTRRGAGGDDLRALTVHHPSWPQCEGFWRIGELYLILSVPPCRDVTARTKGWNVGTICGEGKKDVGCFVAFFWLEAR